MLVEFAFVIILERIISHICSLQLTREWNFFHDYAKIKLVYLIEYFLFIIKKY